jgi:hypothetical protein
MAEDSVESKQKIGRKDGQNDARAEEFVYRRGGYNASTSVITRAQIFGTPELKEGLNAQPSIQARNLGLGSPLPKKEREQKKE